MSIISKSIITLALLCVLLQQCHGMYQQLPQVCTFWKGVYYPSRWRTVVFDRYTFEDSKFLYAVCGPSSYGQTTCKLIRDKDEAFQAANYTCEIDMKPAMRSAVVGEKFRVVPFGRDRAILVWLERTNTATRLGLTSVKFVDCSWHEVRLDVDHSFNEQAILDSVKILTHENTYDVMYFDSKQCGNDKYCKLSVDVEANKVIEPTTWSPVESGSQIVDLKTLNDRYDAAVAVEVSGSSGENRLSILQGDAKKVLKVYGTSAENSLATSTSNELIATCQLRDTTLNCAQYDQSGGTIVDSTNQLQAQGAHPRVIAVHNLRGGAGLLALINDEAQNQYYVLRLDLSGKQVGKLDVTKNFKCDQSLNAVAGHFWEKDEQYCASLACYENDLASSRKSERGHLSATARCFYLSNLEPVS